MYRAEVIELARQCGVGTRAEDSERALENEVEDLLQKFHDLGLLVWHRIYPDVVIIDPLWLIHAVCTIIRDPKHHALPHNPEIAASLGPAVLRADSLKVLLGDGCSADWEYTDAEQKHVINLMVHYGLAVTLPDTIAVEVDAWLIPALLELVPTSLDDTCAVDPDRASGAVASIDFFFTVISKALDQDAEWDLRQGFLPTGLFHRIIGCIIAIEQPSELPQMSRSCAHLVVLREKWGAKWVEPALEYTLELHSESNSFSVRVLLGTPTDVFTHIDHVVNLALKECDNLNLRQSRSAARVGFVDIQKLAHASEEILKLAFGHSKCVPPQTVDFMTKNSSDFCIVAKYEEDFSELDGDAQG